MLGFRTVTITDDIIFFFKRQMAARLTSTEFPNRLDIASDHEQYSVICSCENIGKYEHGYHIACLEDPINYDDNLHHLRWLRYHDGVALEGP